MLKDEMIEIFGKCYEKPTDPLYDVREAKGEAKAAGVNRWLIDDIRKAFRAQDKFNAEVVKALEALLQG